MENVRAGVRAFSALSIRRKAVVVACVALIVALIVALCISINMRANIQREYTQARNRTGEALYSNLYILRQTFDMTAVPNTDVENAILPQMRDYFMASVTLNNLLKPHKRETRKASIRLSLPKSKHSPLREQLSPSTFPWRKNRKL